MIAIYGVANNAADNALTDIKLFILIVIIDNNDSLTASEYSYNYIYFIRK